MTMKRTRGHPQADRAREHPRPRRHGGFTLIELVITMTVGVIVVSFVSVFISGPVTGFMDQTRRLRLVDSASASLDRMGRDVRRALPNSIRTTSTGGNVALELLSSVDGARYRAGPPGSDDQILDFAAADGAFNVVGPFTHVAKPFDSTNHYLAIYNVGVPGADAYELANVMTSPGTRIQIAADGSMPGEDRVTLSPPFRFMHGSPSRRVYLVDGPVTYLCDPAAGTLTRFSGYSIAADQSQRDSAAELAGAGADDSLMADRIVSCALQYTPGTAERAGLVSLRLEVGEDGESVELLAQVHVENVP